MTDELKVNVIAKDKEIKVLQGTNFHVLNDLTRCTYKTESIDDFIRYVNDYPGRICSNPSFARVFYNEVGAAAWIDDLDHDSVPDSILSMRDSKYVTMLRGAHNHTYSPADLEEFLRSLRSFSSSAAIDLFNITRDLVVRKVLKVDRKKDNKGNYYHAIKFESDAEDLNLPETISFSVPIFETMPDQGEFTFEPTFEAEVENGTPVLGFKLLNYQFADQLFENRTMILKSKFENLTVKRFWGTFELRAKTDEWRYLSAK